MSRRGRPRGFDRAQALERATMAFWEHGYEATSVADLTRVMGITPPSLYTAFGDKRRLFLEAVDHYQTTFGAPFGAALREGATARECVELVLRRAAADYTDPGHPHGCLIISAAVNCGPQSADVQEELRSRRQANIATVERRISADIETGELPAGVDAHALATFYGATLQGMSTQARDGASRADLEAVAAYALSAWPG